LPEPSGSEEERTRELEEVTEVTHEVIAPEETASLETESTKYAQESAVLDRRIESQERVQTLEAGPGTSSTPQPTRRALQRANAVRSSAAQRRPTPAASYDPRYVARARLAVEKLTELTTPQEADRRRIEKVLDFFGTSLDELLADRLDSADQSTNASAKAQILSSLTQRGWSADRLRDGLRKLAASAAPGQQADIVTAVEAGERLLADLTAMGEAIESSGAPLASAADYLSVVMIVSAGVARTLDALADGKGIRPWTKAQRCGDLAIRLAALEAGPLDQMQEQVDAKRLDKRTAEGRVAALNAELADSQRRLKALSDADDNLDHELQTADEARRAAIEAELAQNAKTETFLRGKADAARNDIPVVQGRARQAAKDLAALVAQMQAMSTTIRESGLSFAGKSRSMNWSDAVTRARKAAADLDLTKDERQALDKALSGLGPDLDARFDALRLVIEDLSDLTSVDNVIALGWEFTRLVSSVRLQLGRLGLPAKSGAAQDLQLTLAKLAGYLANLVSVRGGLTTT
jgi:hypothetical protein